MVNLKHRGSKIKFSLNINRKMNNFIKFYSRIYFLVYYLKNIMYFKLNEVQTN